MRQLIGGQSSDYAILDPTLYSGVWHSAANLTGGTCWSAAVGGTPYTDLTKFNTTDPTPVCTDSRGKIIPFYGPDEATPTIFGVWVDFGGVSRSWVPVQFTSTAFTAVSAGAFAPKAALWVATTLYRAGQLAVEPGGTLVRSNLDHTSGASYSAANWTAVAAPVTGSTNYAPASGSANYAPASGSPSYAPPINAAAAASTANFAVTGTATDIPGAALTINSPGVSGMWVVNASYLVTNIAANTNQTWIGTLVVDTTTPPPSAQVIFTSANQAVTTSQTWLIVSISAGNHTFKLQTYMTGTGGNYTVNSAATTLTVMRVA